MTLEVRKNRLIKFINSLDDEALAKIENAAIRIKDQITHKPNVLDAVKPIRTNVSLEQIMEEQNYKPISYKEFRELADQLELNEPIEELLALTKLEQGYKAMSEDKERESEAFDWIEGTLNSDEL